MSNTKESSIDGIALLEFQFVDQNEFPSIYTFTTYGEVDIPLSVDGKLIFFPIERCAQAYELYSDEIKKEISLPHEVSLTLNIPKMINLIKKENIDENSVILNCLNIFFDQINQIDVIFPESLKKILFKLADHLTFDSNFQLFLNQEKITRDEILEGTTWCIGTILINSKFLF